MEPEFEAVLEITSTGRSPMLVPVTGTRIAIGRAPDNDVSLDGDPRVSRIHAVMERYPAGWSIRDIGSVNGTDVNGRTLSQECRLESGDEIRLGDTRIVFRLRAGNRAETTLVATEKPPEVTRRERDILLALCRPIAASPEMFAEPATIAQIARDLVVAEATVKFHISNLYAKFGISDPGLTRRARLANEAIRRGSVRLADLRPPGSPGE